MDKWRSSPTRPPLVLALVPTTFLFLLALWGSALADETTKAKNVSDSEFASRGERAAREIKYGDWRKVCFKTPGTSMVCRTSISGTWDTGQSAVRADLIEREGEGAARLQLFLPVGLYLQAGVKISVDQDAPYQIPYVWCLTNACIAAQAADPKLLQEMEKGQTLTLAVVDSSVLTVSTTLPLEHFAAAHRNPPAKIFEQDVDE
jgi:invasion protein IalB